MRDVSLSILAGPPDVPFVDQMVRHVVRANRFPFKRRVLVIDTVPNPRYSDSTQTEALRTIASRLIAEGVVDAVLDLGEMATAQRDWELGNFARKVPWSRDYRGVPLFGWIAGIEACDCEHHAHFDCDVFLYQAADYSWIEQGITTLDLDPSLFCVAPHPGPPRADGTLHQTVPYSEDPRGFYRFASFSSRRFLLSRATYRRILPLHKGYVSRNRYLKSFVSRSSPMQTWEMLVNERIVQLGLSRANLKDARCWAIHAPDHGPEFQRRLTAVIQQVECGQFPSGQAGHYDLRLADWEEPGRNDTKQ